MAKNWTRYEQAKRLRDGGMTFRAIGEEMGISVSLAQSMVSRQEEHLRQWHYGLATHIANQLKQQDIHSREECQRLFIDQEDDLIIQGKKVWPKEWHQRRYSTWAYLTIQSFNALREWLGAPPLSTTKKDTLLKAKKFLESHGYTVTLPPETTDASH